MIKLGNNISFKAIQFNVNDEKMLKEAKKNGQLVVFDIDTQDDFMHQHSNRRDGLPVPGAEGIISNLRALTELSQIQSIAKIVTMDTHTKKDPEFDDFRAFSDSHCVKGTPGWHKIPETNDTRPNTIIDVDQSKADQPTLQELKSMVSNGEVLTIEKNTFDLTCQRDAAGNIKEAPKAVGILKGLKSIGVNVAIVYGVATDFCVKAAVEALKKIGIKPIVVKDAVKQVATNGIEDPNDPTYKDVTVVSTDRVLKALQ